MQCPSDHLSNSQVDGLLVLRLPENDPYFDKKKKFLQKNNFGLELRISLESPPSSEWTTIAAETMLHMSRIIHMDEDELYFFEDGISSPNGYYSPKNELEALNSVISLIDSSVSSITKNELVRDSLQALRRKVAELLHEFGNINETETRVVKSSRCDKEHDLVSWAESKGMQNRLKIAHIEGFGRGAIAKEDLKVGDFALEIPLSIIISEDNVRESDMYPILQKIDGISAETMLLLWSMKERHNRSSKFKAYFDSLPKEFNTGLSFGVEAIMALDGTLLLEELMQAKEHLRTQYDELFPTLCDSFADYFPSELFTWDQYLWACELWYSNSMKVQFPDGGLRTCLIPVAGFLNHSIFPHITRYGKIESTTKTMRFPMSRPCKAGEQCYLSYGNLSSSHLVTFYGFMPKGDNPYYVIPLDLDDGSVESNWTNHMVRGTWFSNNHDIFHYGLPSPLLDYLRKAQNFPLDGCSLLEKLQNDIQLLNDLSSTFSAMMENLGDPNAETEEDAEWDVKLALQFKNQHRRILSSILNSCESGIKMLDDEIHRLG